MCLVIKIRPSNYGNPPSPQCSAFCVRSSGCISVCSCGCNTPQQAVTFVPTGVPVSCAHHGLPATTPDQIQLPRRVVHEWAASWLRVVNRQLALLCRHCAVVSWQTDSYTGAVSVLAPCAVCAIPIRPWPWTTGGRATYATGTTMKE